MLRTTGLLPPQMNWFVDMTPTPTDPVVLSWTVVTAVILSLLTIGAVALFRKSGVTVTSVLYLGVLILVYAFSPRLEVAAAKLVWQSRNPGWMSIGVFSWPLFWVPWLIGFLAAIAYWYFTRSRTR